MSREIQLKLHWDSNPHAIGAAHLRMEGRCSSIGGTSVTSETARGYVFGHLVYEGDNELEARQAVESALRSLPEWAVRGLADDDWSN